MEKEKGSYKGRGRVREERTERGRTEEHLIETEVDTLDQFIRRKSNDRTKEVGQNGHDLQPTPKVVETLFQCRK